MLRERVWISRERGRVGETSSRVVCMSPLRFHVPLTRPEDPRDLTTTLDGGPTHEVPNEQEDHLVKTWEIQDEGGDKNECQTATMVHRPERTRTMTTTTVINCVWLEGVTGSLDEATGTNESTRGVWSVRAKMYGPDVLVVAENRYMTWTGMQTYFESSEDTAGVGSSTRGLLVRSIVTSTFTSPRAAMTNRRTDTAPMDISGDR